MAYSGMCPITHIDILSLQEPVVCRDGHTYEKSAILTWLDKHGTSPVTRLPMSRQDMFPNRALMTNEVIDSNGVERATILSLACTPQGIDQLRPLINKIIDDMSTKEGLIIRCPSSNDTTSLKLTKMTSRGKKQATRTIDRINCLPVPKFGPTLVDSCLQHESIVGASTRIILLIEGYENQTSVEEGLLDRLQRISLCNTLEIVIVATGQVDSFYITTLFEKLALKKDFTWNFRYVLGDDVEFRSFTKDEDIRLANDILLTCLKTGQCCWYGLPGDTMELPPSAAQLKSAKLLLSLRTHCDPLLREALDHYWEWGRHYLRSLTFGV